MNRALLQSAERARLSLAKFWGLTEPELQQLFASHDTDAEAASRYAVDSDSETAIQALRISSLLGIHQALSVLFPDAAQAGRWIRRPNSATPFSGSTALDHMIAGGLSAMIEVRRYLDAELT